MSAFFDQASAAHQRELDAAFAAGERRGRRGARCETIDEINKRAQDCADAYREGVEVGLLVACIAAAFIAAWGGVAYWIFA